MSEAFVLDPPEGIRIELNQGQRDVVVQSMSLVARIVIAGGQESWRLDPPRFEDLELEAAEALANPGSQEVLTGVAARLEQGAELVSRKVLSLAEADDLATLLNYCRLVLAETEFEGEPETARSFGRDLYEYLSYLLSALLEVIS